jgi:hypothetical protein
VVTGACIPAPRVRVAIVNAVRTEVRGNRGPRSVGANQIMNPTALFGGTGFRASARRSLIQNRLGRIGIPQCQRGHAQRISRLPVREEFLCSLDRVAAGVVDSSQCRMKRGTESRTSGRRIGSTVSGRSPAHACREQEGEGDRGDSHMVSMPFALAACHGRKVMHLWTVGHARVIVEQ